MTGPGQPSPRVTRPTTATTTGVELLLRAARLVAPSSREARAEAALLPLRTSGSAAACPASAEEGDDGVQLLAPPHASLLSRVGRPADASCLVQLGAVRLPPDQRLRSSSLTIPVARRSTKAPPVVTLGPRQLSATPLGEQPPLCPSRSAWWRRWLWPGMADRQPLLPASAAADGKRSTPASAGAGDPAEGGDGAAEAGSYVPHPHSPAYAVFLAQRSRTSFFINLVAIMER